MMISFFQNGLCVEYVDEDGIDYMEPAPKPEIHPELPAEVWSETAFDADRAWAATVMACKGAC
jgi:hypothetical protein